MSTEAEKQSAMMQAMVSARNTNRGLHRKLDELKTELQAERAKSEIAVKALEEIDSTIVESVKRSFKRIAREALSQIKGEKGEDPEKEIIDTYMTSTSEYINSRKGKVKL